MQPREIRVYLVDVNDDFGFLEYEASGDYQAIIDYAERKGRVYSIRGFMTAINDEVADNLTNTWVLICYNTGEPIDWKD